MKYEILNIPYGDKEFIDDLCRDLDIDINEIDIDFNSITNSADFTNQLIYWIYSEYIQWLDISDKSKERLQEKIYTNCLDSWIDDSIENYPKKERKKLIKLDLY